MKTTKFAAVIMSIIFIITAASCSSKGNQKVDNSIKIFLLDEDTNIRNAVQEYNQKTRDQITEKVFYRDQREEMAETLRYDLAVGEGPDVIIFEPDMLPELSKYMEKGAFYNIDESMKKDKDFKIEDYNSTVMEYGMYNGKRYSVPLFYSVKALFSTDELLRNSGISDGSSFLNIDDVCNTASDYMKQGKGKYFFSPLDFSYFMDNCGDYVNITEKKANFNTAGFEKLLDSYKKLYETSDKEKDFSRYLQDGTESKLLKDGASVMCLHDVNCFKLLWARYNDFNEDVTPKVRSIGVNPDEMHVCATPIKIAAINANCKNKKAAYDFIKLLLSVKYQENALVFNLPVNSMAYEIQKEIFIKGVGGKDYVVSLRNGGIKSDSTARKAAADVEKIIGRVGKAILSDYKIYSLVDEVVDRYLKGSITNSEAAREIQDKVQEYLNAPMIIPKKKTAPNQEVKVKHKLSLCTYGANGWAESALRVYKNKFEDVDIEITGDYTDESINKVATAIMSGEGPDTIIFFPASFSSLHKIIDSGAFYCLDDLIKKDKAFKPENYFEEAFKAGVYQGKRYYFPLNFVINYLYTTPNTLDNSHIQYDEGNWTWTRFADLASSYLKDRNGKDQYFLLGRYFRFSIMLASCDVPFIDYDRKKTAFNSPEFIGLIKAYGDLKKSIIPGDIGEQEYDERKFFKSYVFALNEDLYSFAWRNICHMENFVNQYNNEELKVIPMPNVNKCEKPSVRISQSAAITSTYRYKEDAYNLISALLSKDMQRSVDSFGNISANSMFIPVNKEAYEEDKALFFIEKSSAYFIPEVKDKFKPLSPSLAAQFDHIVKSARLKPQYDFNVIEIITKEVDGYIQGKKSAEEAAAEIDQKVTLILNE